MLFSAFLNYSQKNNIIKEGARVLAAVSGGADSVCLLHLLSRMRAQGKITLFCAHVNHGLRANAARDEEFVKSLCEKWDIPLFVKHADVKAVAAEKKVSDETAGREVRYAFFAKMCKEHGIDITLTAHNKCDQAETVLMHLFRGSALKGLTGLAPVRDGWIGHPLLEFERCEIEEYLINNGIKWIEDETNSLPIYTRNRIRHNLLPLIKEYNPRAVDAICSCADILRRENDFLDKYADGCNAFYADGGEVFIDREKLKNQDISIIYRVISKALTLALCDAGRVNIERIYSLFSGNGRMATLSGGFVSEVEQNKIVIYKKREKISFCYELTLGVPLYIKEIGATVTAQLSLSDTAEKGALLYSGGKIEVRSRKDGDIFSPEGMGGSKKLKEFFIDRKIPRRKRDSIPIITIDKKIAFVSPFRRDSSFVPKKGDAKVIIHIRGEAPDEKRC